MAFAELANAKLAVQQLEARRAALEEEVIQKQAHLFGLPRLALCSLGGNDENLRYCRLTDPKRDGRSLRKKQCDLWEFCWGAGSLLAHVVSSKLPGDMFAGKACLELGGGIGLASLSVLHHNPTVKRVVMTDLVPDALRVFELSCRLQSSSRGGGAVQETRVLNWNKTEDYDVPGMRGEFDVILGSDVLFMSWCAPLVANICATCLKPGGVVLVLDPYRLNDELFVDRLNEAGLVHCRVLLFTPQAIALVAAPLEDELGSFVPVKRAKLLVASRTPLSEALMARLLHDGQLVVEEELTE